MTMDMDMTKEPLTFEDVKKDMRKLVRSRTPEILGWRLCFILLATLAAVLVGLLTQKVWAGCLVFSIAVYHIVRLVLAFLRNRKALKLLKSKTERCSFCVSVEELKQVTEEVAPHFYSPFKAKRNQLLDKCFRFTSGAVWKMPDVDRHYTWSRVNDMSQNGLDNTSVSGDTFYFISLEADKDVCYIYNTKLFELTDTEHFIRTGERPVL